MNDHETPEPDVTPTSEQYGRTRDGMALMELLIAGDHDAALALMDALMRDPHSLPLVFKSMSGLIEQALQTPQGTDPGRFFAATRQVLDDSQGHQR